MTTERAETVITTTPLPVPPGVRYHAVTCTDEECCESCPIGDPATHGGPDPGYQTLHALLSARRESRPRCRPRHESWDRCEQCITMGELARFEAEMRRR